MENVKYSIVKKKENNNNMREGSGKINYTNGDKYEGDLKMIK